MKITKNENNEKITAFIEWGLDKINTWNIECKHLFARNKVKKKLI